MITQIKIWQITCKMCRKIFHEEQKDRKQYFLTKEEAIEALKSPSNLWRYKRDKAYCDRCWSYERNSRKGCNLPHLCADDDDY